MFQKGFSTILVVVIMLVVVVGGVFTWQYWPEQVEQEPVEDITSNWQTYRDQGYNIEIKYPKDMGMQQIDAGQGITSRGLVFKTSYTDQENITGLSMFFQSFDMEGVMREAINIDSETEIIIDGVVGSEIKGIDQAGQMVDEIWLKQNDLIFILKRKHQEISDQMISTFKFINKEIATRRIQLYYHNTIADDDGNGFMKCDPDSVLPVEREIPVTITPIQDTIKLLLKNEFSLREKDEGFSSELPLSGVELSGVNLESGVLTLSFNDPNHVLNGGSCRVGILRAEVTKTALQFPEVEQIKFKPEFSYFQP